MIVLRSSIQYLFVIMGSMVLLVSCGATTASGPQGDGGVPAGSQARLRAVATTSIVADLVRNVGGERVDVVALLPPGTDPHSYAPSPSDLQAVVDAQIVFEHGLGLDQWLAEAIANAGGTRPTVVVSQGLAVLPLADEHAEEHADEHAEAESDPHLWFDVQNAIGYVRNIRDGLTENDPEGAAMYESNAAAYIAELEALDAEIIRLVDTVPAERRKLVTNHDTFSYFAARYGFELVGSVFANLSGEQEPSARQLADLVALIKAEQVPAIFAETTVNSRLAEQIADEADVKLVTDLYTDALGTPGSAGDTYIKMMRFDVETIVSALQ